MRDFLAGAGFLLLFFFCCACQGSVSAHKPDLVKFNDLAAKGVRIGIVDPDLGPAGRYALDVIAKLKSTDAAAAAAITGNIVTHEAHVRSLLNKLLQREIDAGFFYHSDALAAAGKIAVIKIPPAFAVSPEYSLARIKGTAFPGPALDFIDWLRAAKQRKLWLKYGFKPLPAVAASIAVTSVRALSPANSKVELTVFAAAVFYDALSDLAKIYKAQKGVEIVCEFAGSGKLFQKIEQGAQGPYGADIFLSASPVYIAKLEQLGLVDNQQIFMCNDLVVGIAKP